MESVKFGNCPFCGAELIADDINLMYLECMDKWFFSHYCCEDEAGNHQTSIHVLGKTREEVINRCIAALSRKDV